MILHIKNMVSQRCTQRVDEELNRLGIPHKPAELGFVELLTDITPEQEEELQRRFEECKLTLMKRKGQITVERIKTVIIQLVHSDDMPNVKLSVYLSEKCRANFRCLSKAFVEHTGVTIRAFILRHKVERAKELIRQGELNFSEIADRLQFYNLAHFTMQFKKFSGVSPTEYRKSGAPGRSAIENL